jgi:hypothetical protein
MCEDLLMNRYEREGKACQADVCYISRDKTPDKSSDSMLSVYKTRARTLLPRLTSIIYRIYLIGFLVERAGLDGSPTYRRDGNRFVGPGEIVEKKFHAY